MKKYIYSPSLHQDLYQKLFKYFSNYIPKYIIPNFFKADGAIDEVDIDKDFFESEREIKTYESIGEVKYPQKYEDGVKIS